MRHRPKWELALEMIDELTVWGHTPAVMVGDAGYGEIGGLRTGLDQPWDSDVVQGESLHQRPRRRGDLRTATPDREERPPRQGQLPIRTGSGQGLRGRAAS